MDLELENWKKHLIFAVRQLLEKIWECGRKMVLLFINIVYTCNSVARNFIWKDMEKMGIDEGYIRIYKEMYLYFKDRLRSSHRYTEYKK